MSTKQISINRFSLPLQLSWSATQAIRSRNELIPLLWFTLNFINVIHELFVVIAASWSIRRILFVCALTAGLIDHVFHFYDLIGLFDIFN